jgi:hypothetical protein
MTIRLNKLETIRRRREDRQLREFLQAEFARTLRKIEEEARVREWRERVDRELSEHRVRAKLAKLKLKLKRQIEILAALGFILAAAAWWLQ